MSVSFPVSLLSYSQYNHRAHNQHRADDLDRDQSLPENKVSYGGGEHRLDRHDQIGDAGFKVLQGSIV